MLAEHIKKLKMFSSVNLYFQDESRIGLFTRNSRMITAKGVSPICNYQHEFKNTYLFGAFSPINGHSFILDLPVCDTEMFQLFLDEFSSQQADQLKIVFLDNGAFHKSKRLAIPSNIVLIFLPPYSPELNPAELVWKFLKDKLSNQAFKSLKCLQKTIDMVVRKHLTTERVISLTSFTTFVQPFQTILGL